MLNKKAKVASNFLIAQDGTIAQLVDIKDAAWCNGTSPVANSNVYYGKSSNSIVKGRKNNANYYTISIEFEGVYAKTKRALSDKQLQAAIDLIKWIKQEVLRIYNKELIIDRNHLIGHYEINPITKPNCPGKLFPFDKIIGQANDIPKSEIEILKQDIEKLNKLVNDKNNEINKLNLELQDCIAHNLVK